MELLSQLEQTMAGWMKSVPHLPASWRTWLGNNVWWIIIIGIAACALSILGTIGVLTGGMVYFASLGLSGYLPGALTAWGVLSAVIGLVFLAIEAAFLIGAVQPLRAKQKRGWTYLFAAYTVGVLSVIISALLTLNAIAFVMSILSGAVGLLIGAYFLFEIRGEFTDTKKVTKSTSKTPAKSSVE